MMGARTFMDLVSVDEIYRQSGAITEAQDVICMRDFIQVEKKGFFVNQCLHFGAIVMFIFPLLSVFQPPG